MIKKNCENVCMEQSNNSEEKMHQNLRCIYEDFLRATLTSTIFREVVTFLNRVGPGPSKILAEVTLSCKWARAQVLSGEKPSVIADSVSKK